MWKEECQGKTLRISLIWSQRKKSSLERDRKGMEIQERQSRESYTFNTLLIQAALNQTLEKLKICYSVHYSIVYFLSILLSIFILPPELIALPSKFLGAFGSPLTHHIITSHSLNLTHF